MWFLQKMGFNVSVLWKIQILTRTLLHYITLACKQIRVRLNFGKNDKSECQIQKYFSKVRKSETNITLYYPFCPKSRRAAKPLYL